MRFRNSALFMCSYISVQMVYRILLIQLAALLLLYFMLHSDNVAILKACTAKKAPDEGLPDQMTEQDKVIADAIFGSIAAPLFSRPRGTARVEEVTENAKGGAQDGATRPTRAESPAASQTTAGANVRKRNTKRAAADIDVPSNSANC